MRPRPTIGATIELGELHQPRGGLSTSETRSPNINHPLALGGLLPPPSIQKKNLTPTQPTPKSEGSESPTRSPPKSDFARRLAKSFRGDETFTPSGFPGGNSQLMKFENNYIPLNFRERADSAPSARSKVNTIYFSYSYLQKRCQKIFFLYIVDLIKYYYYYKQPITDSVAAIFIFNMATKAKEILA